MHHNMPANTPNPQMARDRAAAQLTQRFGASAATSVSQLQSQPAGQQQTYSQMHHPSNGQMPQIKQEHGHSSIGHSQTDGADDALADWKAEVARRREAAQNGQGDHLLREYVKHRMSGLQAGGLLRPLSEQESSTTTARRAALVAPLARTNASQSDSFPKGPGQFDGVDDDVKEEADEDAINSDLDDPDDLIDHEAEADEADGQVMLCTYDKVQRVKNKWKCTLKDGILTTGGKE
jgi:transcription initiation factor TFIIA large subunit